MSKKNKQPSVPTLRFPEFRDAGEWEENVIKDFAKVTTGNKDTQDKVDDGEYPFFVRSQTVERINTYSYEGEAILTSGDGVGVGKNFHYIVGRFDFHQRVYCIFDFDKFVSGRFVFQYFSEHFYKRAMQLSAKNSVDSVRMAMITEMPISLPDIEEQQKIADCLSSLDELITAEAQKLDTLKAHKKGLMQKLFPAEGETVPKLRFPEFRDAGEWEEKSILSLSSCGLSNGVFNDPKKVGKGYKLINVLDMYIETSINENTLSLIDLSLAEFAKNKVENGDIFFTRSSLVKSGIACSNVYLGDSDDITFDGHLIRFRPNKIKVNPVFMNYLVKTYRVRNQLIARGKTATMTTIGQSDVASVLVPIPSLSEQQKIADCLSSLDELMTAQIGKIDALKTHKKGLMQQLFPAGETR